MRILAITSKNQRHRTAIPREVSGNSITIEECVELLKADGFTAEGPVEIMVCTEGGYSRSLGTTTMEAGQ